jgi:alkylation response protein AidB-like acyl-CoA dehydrogenase
MSKLFASELTQRIAATAMRVLGTTGALLDSERATHVFPRHYLGAVPATIRGGTSEVQRNVIATRGLGLPRG